MRLNASFDAHKFKKLLNQKGKEIDWDAVKRHLITRRQQDERADPHMSQIFDAHPPPLFLDWFYQNNFATLEEIARQPNVDWIWLVQYAVKHYRGDIVLPKSPPSHVMKRYLENHCLQSWKIRAQGKHDQHTYPFLQRLCQDDISVVTFAYFNQEIKNQPLFLRELNWIDMSPEKFILLKLQLRQKMDFLQSDRFYNALIRDDSQNNSNTSISSNISNVSSNNNKSWEKFCFVLESTMEDLVQHKKKYPREQVYRRKGRLLIPHSLLTMGFNEKGYFRAYFRLIKFVHTKVPADFGMVNGEAISLLHLFWACILDQERRRRQEDSTLDIQEQIELMGFLNKVYPKEAMHDDGRYIHLCIDRPQSIEMETSRRDDDDDDDDTDSEDGEEYRDEWTDGRNIIDIEEEEEEDEDEESDEEYEFDDEDEEPMTWQRGRIQGRKARQMDESDSDEEETNSEEDDDDEFDDESDSDSEEFRPVLPPLPEVDEENFRSSCDIVADMTTSVSVALTLPDYSNVEPQDESSGSDSDGSSSTEESSEDESEDEDEGRNGNEVYSEQEQRKQQIAMWRHQQRRSRQRFETENAGEEIEEESEESMEDYEDGLDQGRSMNRQSTNSFEEDEEDDDSEDFESEEDEGQGQAEGQHETETESEFEPENEEDDSVSSIGDDDVESSGRLSADRLQSMDTAKSNKFPTPGESDTERESSFSESSPTYPLIGTNPPQLISSEPHLGMSNIFEGKSRYTLSQKSIQHFANGNVKLPYGIFFVHNGKQKVEAVSTMHRLFTHVGYRCFMDVEIKNSQGSPNITMEQALESCRHVIVILSDSFLERPSPCAELIYGFQRMQWLRQQSKWQSLWVVLYDRPHWLERFCWKVQSEKMTSSEPSMRTPICFSDRQTSFLWGAPWEASFN